MNRVAAFVGSALMALSALADVQDFKVTTDRTIDSSSLESIVRKVIERVGAKTNDEKAVALFEYLHKTIFHWACPREPQSIGPLKILNVYLKCHFWS